MKSTTALSNNLRALMEKHGLTPFSLAPLARVGQPVIHRILSEETGNPKIATLRSLANYFDISIDQLIGDVPMTNEHNKGQTRNWSEIPLLTWEQAINHASQDKSLIKEFVPTTAKVSPDAYALIMKDATMQPKFPEQTLLIIDPQLEPNNKDYVVVHQPEQAEASFKQLLADGHSQYLKPLNPDFPVYVLKNDNDCTFCGVLVEARMRF